MKTRKRYIWVGQIPEIFGYGIIVLDKNEELATKALKREFYRWKRAQPSPSTFKSAFEDWGGRIEKVELGKAYCDGFG